LAIDLRHRRFGFAAFEGHRRLLGWGVRTYPTSEEAEVTMMSKRLSELLKLYLPSAIVVMKERWEPELLSVHRRSMKEELLHLANTHAIEIRAIGQEQIRMSFLTLNSNTRYEIASSLAQIFPELTSRLPRERRTWEPAHSIMTMFDAVALGLSYWQHESECIFAPGEPDVDIG
jgi:hypothetical protein